MAQRKIRDFENGIGSKPAASYGSLTDALKQGSILFVSEL
jgi:hypothetical protein